MGKVLDTLGLERLTAWINSKLATDTNYGMVKLNPAENIDMNADGQLTVGGRLGQTTTGGLYTPATITPTEVGAGSLLVTEASGTTLKTKSLAVSTGTGITLKSTAVAGATQYIVANNYANRIALAAYIESGAVAALNEADAKAGNYAHITSVTINNAAFTPDSSSDNSSTNIVVTTDKTVNPSSTVSEIRVYPLEGGFSNLFVGQSAGGAGGASVVVGQRVFSKSGNACAIVGADIYNTGNGNALFGRQHISRKNRSFLAGTGHDTTNAKKESVAAFGQWSQIDSGTLFAVGNGTSHTARSNAFEVLNDGIALKSPNGTRWKISVADGGTLITSQV